MSSERRARDDERDDLKAPIGDANTQGQRQLGEAHVQQDCGEQHIYMRRRTLDSSEYSELPTYAEAEPA